MNLYQLKSDTEHISKYLEDNFVSIGSQDSLEVINLFVHTMQDGDYVLVADQDIVHLGDLGDYFYDELSDTLNEGLGHRRGVTWLVRIPRADMNAEVQELLNQPERITRFQYPIGRAQLEQWGSNLLGGPSPVTKEAVLVDDKTIETALDILKKALHSDDEDRRERAAIAILQYVK